MFDRGSMELSNRREELSGRRQQGWPEGSFRPCRLVGGVIFRPVPEMLRAGATRLGWSSVSNPRIDVRVQDIDEEIDRHDHERDVQHDTLNNWIITPFHGFEGEPSHTGPRIDALDDHTSPDQESEVKAYKRDQWYERVSQRVFPNYSGVCNAL